MMIEDLIRIEMTNAVLDYGNFNSTHEVYGVLKEEVDEFFDCIKNKESKEKHIHELIQIAAISIRCVKELSEDKIKYSCQ